MTQHRTEKINELIKTEISSLLSRGLKDPRLEGKVIGISRVNTTPDMKYCKVFVTIYSESEDGEKEVMDVLNKAKGFIRKHVADALTTRYSPELTFVHDDSIKDFMYIDNILKQINDEK